MPVPDIPADQLERITPIVEALRASLRGLTQELPYDAASALTFHPEGERPQ